MTMNASSDSTWDKQSQTSHSPEKTPIPVETEKQRENEDDTEKEQSGEKDVVQPVVLKPAPPPTLNVWQQRKEAQEAKAKANSASSSQQSGKLQGLGIALASSVPPPTLASNRPSDLGRLENKKKPRGSNNQVEDVPASTAVITNKRKGSEGKDRVRDEGIALVVLIGIPIWVS